MTIGVIGAGRAGGALAAALRHAGHRITAVSDLEAERAAGLAARLGAAVLPSAGTVRAAAVVLIAVQDGAIAPLAAGLAPQVADCRGRVFLHLSGAHPAALLGPLAGSGALGSMHPLLSLAGMERDVEDLGRCFYALEGEPPAVATAEDLVRSLGGRRILLDPADKVLYHAAAVFASNYLVTLVDMALGIYSRIGLDRSSALTAIWPLVEGSLANLKEHGPEAALTGPISRGDLATVRGHLAELDRINTAAAPVYRALGLAATALAERAGRIDGAQAEALGAVLAECSEVSTTND